MRPGLARPYRIAAGLALQDLGREKTQLACQVLTLTAVLAPLLILFGLKSGVLQAFTDDLETDAAVRQILIRGVGSYPPSLLDTLRQDPRVGFVAPHPHTINADTFFALAGQRGTKAVNGAIMGSGPGDPLLGPGDRPPAADETVLSAALARNLGATAGSDVLIVAERNQGETAILPLKAIQVLGADAWPVSGALLNPETLMAVDRWSEGYLVPRLGETGRRLDNPIIPTFRLFAADLASVRPLARWLSAQGMNLRTQVNRIDALARLAFTLDLVFTTIATVAASGYLLSFGASLWANVSRKRAALSLLRLQGLPRRASLAFPTAQALSIAAGGWLGAGLLYLAAATLLNERLGPDFAQSLAQGFGVQLAGGRDAGGDIARLSLYHFLLAGAASLTVALAAAAAAGRRILTIDPAEGLRSA